jgi:hypothetical protein
MATNTCSTVMGDTTNRATRALHSLGRSHLFSRYSATFMTELLKLTVAVVLRLATIASRSFGRQRRNANAAGAEEAPECPMTRRDYLVFLVPAVGYFIVNNLRYVVFQMINPGLVAVLW